MKTRQLVCAAFLTVAALAAGGTASAEPPLPAEHLTKWDQILDPNFGLLQSEWWYTIGFLSGTNQSGQPRRLAFMVNVVRAATLYKTVPIPLIYASADMELSLLDMDSQKHYTFQDPTELPDTDNFSVQSVLDESHYAKRGNIAPDGTLLSHFVVGSADFTMDLTTQPMKDQAEFGDAGIVDNASLGKAVYVSRTRMQVAAGSTVHLGSETITVTGQAWEDHQLSDLHLGNPVKWNWFAVMLNDNTEVMAYQLEDAQSGAVLKNYAGHVLASGAVENLDGQFSVTERDHAPYATLSIPTSWDISLPNVFSASISHTVPLPDVKTAFGDVKGTYFEGPTNITNDDGKVQDVWAEHFNGQLFDP